MAEREASVIVKAKNQASQTFIQIFGDVNGQLNIMSGAQNKAAEAAKKHGLSIVDLAAKLYLVQVGLRNVANALKGAYEFAKLGATVEQMGTSFAKVVTFAGGTVEVLDELRAISKGTISDFDLMAATNQALVGTQGDFRKSMISAIPQLLELARASSILNPHLGDTTQQFDRLTLGLKRLEPRIIDDIGLELRLTEVNKNYAEQIGKTVDALTTEERSTALLNAVLAALPNYLAQAGEGADSAVDPFYRLEASGKNLKNSLANLLTDDDVAIFLNSLSSMMEGTQDFIEENEYAAAFLKGFVQGPILAFNDGLSATKIVLRELGLITGELNGVEKDRIKIIEDETRAISGLNYNYLTQEEIQERLKKQQEDDKKNREKTSDFVYQLSLKELQIREQAAEKLESLNQKSADDWEDYQERLTKIQEDYSDQRNKLLDDAADERISIEMRANERIGDIQKTIDELQAEYEGRNPFLPEDVQKTLEDAEGNLESFEEAIQQMRRTLRRMEPGEARDAFELQIDEQEEVFRQHEKTVAELRENARKTERQNRLLFRIQELQEEKTRLATERDMELAELDTTLQAKLDAITLAEEKQTLVLSIEYEKRRIKLEQELNKLVEDTRKKIDEVNIDLAMSFVEAGSYAELALQEMKLRMHGATEETLLDMQRLRESINGGGGLTSAIQDFAVQGFGTFFGMQGVIMGLNGQLYFTNFMLSQATSNADQLARAMSNVASGGGGPARRQHGGTATAHESIIVGEAGPELFTPSSNGRITPNGLSNAGGGGNTVNITVQSMAFQGSQADAQKFGNWVAPIVLQYMDKFGGNVNAVGSRRIR